MINFSECQMNNQHIQSQCQKAEPYYCDYLRDNTECVPRSVFTHICTCTDCQSEIQWLKGAFTKSEERSLPNVQATLHADQMRLHCALIDLPVRCSTIKSFIPILAIPGMAVRISTPVTEHIRVCSQCAQDLKMLKQLDLSPEQLSCLSRHYTKADGSEELNTVFARTEMKPPTELRRIINRPDSGIVTYFRTEEDTFDEPFTVEIKKESTVTPAFHQQSRPVRAAAKAPRWLFGPVAAAAAVLVIAVLLFQNVSVKATDIGQIYEALKNVQNIVMTHYEADNPNPIQTIWICRSLGMKILETNGSFTLYDINNKIQKSRTGQSPEIQRTDLDRGAVESIAKSMEVPWGLLPFKNTSSLPDGATWEKDPSPTPEAGSGEREVYTLFWSEKVTGNDAGIDYQWRCILDSVTKHPLLVEWWTREPGMPEYEKVAVFEITYPPKDRILQVIDQAGF